MRSRILQLKAISLETPDTICSCPPTTPDLGNFLSLDEVEGELKSGLHDKDSAKWVIVFIDTFVFELLIFLLSDSSPKLP